MRPTLILAFLFVTTASVSLAQPKVFVAPMEDGFDAFLSAAMIDNQVPVKITADECSASFVITGQAVKGQNKWYDTVFGAERDRNQGSIKVVRVADRSVVWAGAAGDRSLWWGALKSGGQKKVANRLARELKKGYFNRILQEESLGDCSKDKMVSRTGVDLVVAPLESTVEVNSSPEGADIEVKGQVIGKAPLTLNLKPGEHTITVRLAGYRPLVKFVRVSAGEIRVVNAELRRY